MTPTVAIAGLGLIGGSLGLALRAAGVRVLATDPALDEPAALASGACDRFLAALPAALEGADVLVLAAPVDRIERTLDELRGRPLPPHLVVTDTGSVKGRICAAGARLASDRGVAFVGGHPLAGSERSGLGAARADLFRGAPWVLVPPAAPAPSVASHPIQHWGSDLTETKNEIKPLERCREIARLAGARPVEMAADRHDRVVASTSHLPHLLAAALAAHLGRRAADDEAFLGLAGRGFLDMTRVADGPPDLWRAILEANGEGVREAASDLVRLLSGDVPAMLVEGREARRKVQQRLEADGRAHE